MPDDRRIALVAVIVTGVVGLGAPLISIVATRQNQRDAFRDERSRVDTAELRGVIDDATVAVATLINNAEVASGASDDDLLPAADEQERKRRAVKALEEDVQRMRRSYYRLQLRLGAREQAVAEYRKLYETSRDLLWHVQFPDWEFVEGGAPGLYSALAQQQDPYLAAATALARSRLD
jgi:hypothetical protein